MRFVRRTIIGIFFCVAVAGGCRRQEPAAESPHLPPDESPPAPATLSDEQNAAIQAITAAGGEIETDQAGFPLRIDLASQRVFADETLLRAALRFPNLKSLRVAVSSVPDATLAELATLTRLEELFLQDASFDDAGLGRLLRAMPSLKRLTLRRLAAVTDRALVDVAACAVIEVLALIEMNQITGAGLEPLTGCTRLRSLDLRHCGRLSTGDLQRLSVIGSLEEIKLGGPAINDEIAGVLVGLPRLKSLTIEDAEITPAFLQKLASAAAAARRIQALAFARCYGVTDSALEPLDKFSSLESLSLHDILVTGKFLPALRDSGAGPLPLETLVVTNAFFGDAAVACLPEVAPHLVRLDLRGNTGLTGQSRQALERLEKLKELRLE